MIVNRFDRTELQNELNIMDSGNEDDGLYSYDWFDSIEPNRTEIFTKKSEKTHK